MRRAYGETEQFNLKQDFGGLIDIEFWLNLWCLPMQISTQIWQFGQIMYAFLRKLKKTGIWTANRCQKLTQAYLDLRKKPTNLPCLNKKYRR